MPRSRIRAAAVAAAFLFSASAAVVVAAPAAGAASSSVAVHDPIGDNTSSNPRGDLVAATLDYDPSAIVVGATTHVFDNPETSFNWRGFALGNPNFVTGTSIEWDLDVNSDTITDFEVVINNNGSAVVGRVKNGDGSRVLCSGRPGWDAATRSYSVSFARPCVGSPAHIQMTAFMVYETTIDVSTDFTGVTPPAVRSPFVSPNGYWLLGGDGHVYPFGSAPGFADLGPGAIAIAPLAAGTGYWVADFAGHVFTYGTADYFGGAPKLGPAEFVSTMAATPSGRGYWLFTNQGRAFPFGDARSFGDMSGTHLNREIIGSAATPSGQGYYMVGADGGIFTFGDAQFHGSTAGLPLNRPIVGIAPTASGHGYWLVASDGGVFAFNAPFRGSMGATALNQPVAGLVGYGNGYLMVAADGGIFTFSNKAFLGSLPPEVPSTPIIGVAAFVVGSFA